MSKRISIILLVIILIIPNITFAVTEEGLQYLEKDTDLLFFIETFQYIKDTYPFEVKDSHLLEGGLKGMLQTLDPYSDYYTPDEAKELYKSMFGIFSGIGVYIEKKDSYINILNTMKDAPGEKAGLMKDDLITSIDGKDTKDISLNDASKLIQGPKGTVVKLGIKRATITNLIYIEITRDTISINPVSYEIINGEIGYIKLTEFSQSANTEIKKALDVFDKKGLKKVILDIRSNPGGLLDQSVEISKHFVSSGPIVHIKEKSKELLTYISTTEKLKYKLVVLVNEYSASASEIVAGAVKDTKSGTIIGKKTYGKGIVQSMIPLGNGSLIKMTTAEYLTPNKTSIHGIGVVPDIVVENIGIEDEQLKMAINTLE